MRRCIGMLPTVSLVLVVGCGTATPATTSTSAPTSPSGTSNYVSGAAITVRARGDFATFDPQNDNIPSGLLKEAFYDTLLDYDQQGNLIPYLATSWKTEGSSFIFNLRNDAICADGTKVTPAVVLNSFKRFVDPDHPALTIGSVFAAGGPFKVSADEAAGTFTFTMTTPQLDNIYGFAGRQTGIVCPAGINNPDMLKDQPAGSGPWTLAEAVHGDHAVMKLRPEWNWGPSGITASTPGIPQMVTVKIITSETTAANLLLTGGSDAIDVASIAGPDVARLINDPSLNKYTGKSFGLTSLLLNRAAGHPTADDAVRAAVMTAVDPAAWLRIVYEGYGRTSSSTMTPDAVCFDPTSATYHPQPSTAAAQKILVDAGWTLADGKLSKGGVPLSLNLLSSTKYGAGNEYLQSALSQAGFDVALNALDNTTYGQRVLAGNFDVEAIDQGTSAIAYAGPSNSSGLIGNLLGQGGRNLTFANDDIAMQLGAAVAEAGRNAPGGAVNCAAWAKFQQLVFQYHVYLPLVAPNSLVFTTGRVDGSLSPTFGTQGFAGNFWMYLRVKKQ
jgi:peptide/nickel transport system substrate-binding protein